MGKVNRRDRKSLKFKSVLSQIQSSLFSWNTVSPAHLFPSTTFWENYPISKYLLEGTEDAKYCYVFFLGNELEQNLKKKKIVNH